MAGSSPVSLFASLTARTDDVQPSDSDAVSAAAGFDAADPRCCPTCTAVNRHAYDSILRRREVLLRPAP